MRRFLAALHRYCGLCTALFLFVAGLTGAVIAWDHELDRALNPHLFLAASGAAPPRPVLDLLNDLETREPRLLVTYAPLAVEPGRTLQVRVEGRLDPATGKPFQLGFSQMALDPATGAVQGRREWGKASLTRENLLPFLYKLHYSLHLPAVGGWEPGVLLMGLVALVWVLDCFVSLWLSFPKASLWRRSLVFRWRRGGAPLTFDLHRSGGVWAWGLLLVLAVSSVSMNLGDAVVRPLVAAVSSLTPSPFATRVPRPPDQPMAPGVTRERILAGAAQEAARLGWTQPAGGVFYATAYGLYGVGFFAPGNDHGEGGLGNPWLYFDGHQATAAGVHAPGTGSAGDLFMQAQFPLHSGRILGFPGRILISLLGLVVATLSVTGVALWIRRRLAKPRPTAPA